MGRAGDYNLRGVLERQRWALRPSETRGSYWEKKWEENSLRDAKAEAGDRGPLAVWVRLAGAACGGGVMLEIQDQGEQRAGPGPGDPQRIFLNWGPEQTYILWEKGRSPGQRAQPSQQGPGADSSPTLTVRKKPQQIMVA